MLELSVAIRVEDPEISKAPRARDTVFNSRTLICRSLQRLSQTPSTVGWWGMGAPALIAHIRPDRNFGTEKPQWNRESKGGCRSPRFLGFHQISRNRWNSVPADSARARKGLETHQGEGKKFGFSGNLSSNGHLTYQWFPLPSREWARIPKLWGQSSDTVEQLVWNLTCSWHPTKSYSVPGCVEIFLLLSRIPSWRGPAWPLPWLLQLKLSFVPKWQGRLDYSGHWSPGNWKFHLWGKRHRCRSKTKK